MQREIALRIPKDKPTQLAALVCLLSLVICFVQGWTRSNAGIDLVQYVLPAKLWLEGINPYDLAHYSDHYHRLQPEANYWYYAYPSPPHALLIMAPLALLPFALGFKVWWILSFGSLVLSFWCLIRLYGKNWNTSEKLLFVALMAQSRLIQSVAYRGQLSLFELALILYALVLLQRNRQTAAGILLGLACMKYTLALPLILYLVWFRLWKPLAWAAIVVVVGGIAASVPLGLSEVARTLPQSLAFFGNAVSQDIERNYHLMQWQTIYASAFGRNSSLATALNLLTLAVIIGVFVGLWRRTRGRGFEAEVFAALTMFSLTVVYHRVYDGVFVFIVAAVFWTKLVRSEALRSPLLMATNATLFLFLFIFSFQNLVEKVTLKLGAAPVLMALNAWLSLFLLIEVLMLAWRNTKISGTGLHPEIPEELLSYAAVTQRQVGEQVT